MPLQVNNCWTETGVIVD